MTFISENLEGVNMALDCCQAEFLTPERAVISLKGGELYVLSLLLDGGMRSVRGFHFDRAAASVLTTCLAVVEDRYLFLGSRLGNSLLLQFKEKEIGEDERYRKRNCEKIMHFVTTRFGHRLFFGGERDQRRAPLEKEARSRLGCRPRGLRQRGQCRYEQDLFLQF